MIEEAVRTAPEVRVGGAVPITVVVATGQGWPTVAAALDTWQVAAEAAGGEVLVADGSGRKPPTPVEIGRNVRWAGYPGESIFQLRDRAYREARGEVIAVADAHVHVPADWATRMIAAHRRHPEAAAIGGSVTNGATRSIMDWAAFLAVQAAVAAPVPTGRAKRLSGAVNVSYKRSALADRDSYDGMGSIDVLHQDELARRGAILLSDDTIRVAHVKPLGFRDATVLHFHAGRTISGFRRKRIDAVQLARIPAAPFVPLVRFVRTVAILAPKGYGRVLLKCGPAILWLLYAQGLGQLIGYLAGEGDSPRKLP